MVTDVCMPDGDGLELMRRVRAADSSTAVIVLTAFGTVAQAVQAMQNGACDYLTKPFSFEQLQSTVERVMRNSGDTQTSKSTRTEIVGQSVALMRVLDRARLAAQTDADILVEAESGTGKELLARYIHETSRRREKPFIAINCAAVPEQLLESELFGHVRGAFTGATVPKAGKFELANGGTLLLDEIGEMPLELQPKLLRILQEREVERLGDTRTIPVNIRIIATTNVSLQEMVEHGRFRADLYYRLNVIPLSLPPLRERLDDIPVLGEYFAAKFAKQAGRPTPRSHPRLSDWPQAASLARQRARTVELHSPDCHHERRSQHRPGTSWQWSFQSRRRSGRFRCRACYRREPPYASSSASFWKQLCNLPAGTEPTPPKCWESACARFATKSGNSDCRQGGLPDEQSCQSFSSWSAF